MSGTRTFSQHLDLPSTSVHQLKPYISKRRKTQSTQQQSALPPQPNDQGVTINSDISKTEQPISVASISVLDRNLVVNVPNFMLRLYETKRAATKLSKKHSFWRIPKQVKTTFSCGTAAANVVKWSPVYGHMLASCFMNGNVCVWDATRKHTLCHQHQHSGAARDVEWFQDGSKIISGGFDCNISLVDITAGQIIHDFNCDSRITVLKKHPSHRDLFLSGDMLSSVHCWDTRQQRSCNSFAGLQGQILSLEFLDDNGILFVGSSDITRKNACEKAMIVWEFESAAAISGQIYNEIYTCPILKRHPNRKEFVAQSNGNYIAIFSSLPPFKLNKYKRFEQHSVSGYPVGCSFDPGGNVLVSGSCCGRLFFYNYHSGALLRQIPAHKSVCSDVSCHPLLDSTMVSCSWDNWYA